MDTDEELYTRARRGDVAAFDALYGRYERRLFGFVLRFLGDRHDAEEVFHDAFLNVLRGPELRFDEAHFVSWLFRVARNLCANRLRSQRRGQKALGLLVAPADVSVPSPEEQVGHEQRVVALAAAVRRLRQPLAEVFRLRQSGLSYEEMAAALAVPLGTVKSRMNTLVRQLQGELVDEGPETPTAAEPRGAHRDDV